MSGSRPGRGLGAVAAATAAVFVAGQRAGSAVLVDQRRLLTAGHVLGRAETSDGMPSPAIEVVFPFAAAGEVTAQAPAQLVVLDMAAARVDVGMLDLVFEGDSPG